MSFSVFSFWGGKKLKKNIAHNDRRVCEVRSLIKQKNILMNNILQEFISEAEARKKSHHSCIGYCSLLPLAEYWKGRTDECDFWLQKLIALLNEQPEAITEDSHLANTNVGRSAANDETLNARNDNSESSSETAVVGQNEQTKEVYNFYCQSVEYGGKRCITRCSSCTTFII